MLTGINTNSQIISPKRRSTHNKSMNCLNRNSPRQYTYDSHYFLLAQIPCILNSFVFAYTLRNVNQLIRYEIYLQRFVWSVFGLYAVFNLNNIIQFNSNLNKLCGPPLSTESINICYCWWYMYDSTLHGRTFIGYERRLRIESSFISSF